jgi:hypothetical protein
MTSVLSFVSVEQCTTVPNATTRIKSRLYHKRSSLLKNSLLFAEP